MAAMTKWARVIGMKILLTPCLAALDVPPWQTLFRAKLALSIFDDQSTTYNKCVSDLTLCSYSQT
ncbi:hypothetical protein GCM10007392_14830 [Saccharospirillum salsuginis]|uniref:Secreted protein n=1 Tax=Saccharospirillum salsuginis TaxID=418750 RepID=A0A918K4N7_9GAMM|nr:hypothetical protein GCM10007392_14830 [Saccharospirillum salsuginis]